MLAAGNMLALWPLSLGFIVNAPAPKVLLMQPTLAMQQQGQSVFESPTAASLIFPDELVSSPTGTLLAEEAYIQKDFDAAFGLAIPILFGGALFAFYKLLKLFASAF